MKKKVTKCMCFIFLSLQTKLQSIRICEVDMIDFQLSFAGTENG